MGIAYFKHCTNLLHLKLFRIKSGRVLKEGKATKHVKMEGVVVKSKYSRLSGIQVFGILVQPARITKKFTIFIKLCKNKYAMFIHSPAMW
jgi:hypothetical protein